MKTILFDLDGTLVDSGPGIMNCVRYAYRCFGMEPPELEILKTFVGPPLRNTFGLHGIPEDKVEEAVANFRVEYQRTGKYEMTPYPGIPELLERLQKEGNALCIATSKPETLATDVLGRLGLSKYFKLICGATMDATRESKSDVIAYLLSQASPEGQVYMVGDTHFDVIGAKAHGMATIGVSWGYGEVEKMLESGAAAIANDAEELYEILTK